jgi:hypothetical protein
MVMVTLREREPFFFFTEPVFLSMEFGAYLRWIGWDLGVEKKVSLTCRHGLEYWLLPKREEMHCHFFFNE